MYYTDGEPSHVLIGLGLDEETTHYSIRIGLGRFKTLEEINFLINSISLSINSLLRIQT